MVVSCVFHIKFNDRINNNGIYDKQVTEKYNLSASTLRYYEKEGLLPKIKEIKAIKEFMMIMITVARYNYMYVQNRSDNSSYKRLY